MRLGVTVQVLVLAAAGERPLPQLAQVGVGIGGVVGRPGEAAGERGAPTGAVARPGLRAGVPPAIRSHGISCMG